MMQESRMQNGRVIWLYGRPCAGKTTIGKWLAVLLRSEGKEALTLDGDELRRGMNADLGFSEEDRRENIRRVAELAKVLSGKGFDVVCSFVTPTRELRRLVEAVLTGIELHLVFINTSFNVCMQRDIKGHYKKAREGKIIDFTGIGSPFEEPDKHDNGHVLPAEGLPVDDLVKACLKMINN